MSGVDRSVMQGLIAALQGIYRAMGEVDDPQTYSNLLSVEQHTRRALHYMLGQPPEEFLTKYIKDNTGYDVN